MPTFKVRFTNPDAIDGRDDIQRAVIEANDEAHVRSIFSGMEILDIEPQDQYAAIDELMGPEPIRQSDYAALADLPIGRTLGTISDPRTAEEIALDEWQAESREYLSRAYDITLPPRGMPIIDFDNIDPSEF
jgi:hypothetical protein